LLGQLAWAAVKAAQLVSPNVREVGLMLRLNIIVLSWLSWTQGRQWLGRFCVGLLVVLHQVLIY
jgi:hypothetical protein